VSNVTSTTGFVSPNAYAPAPNWGAAPGQGVLMPLPLAGVTIAAGSTGLMSQQPAWSTAQPVVNPPTRSEHFGVLQRTDHDNGAVPFLTRLRSGLVPDSVLDELALDPEVRGAWSVERGA